MTEDMFIVGMVVLAGAIALAMRIIAGSIDGDRIEKYVQSQGWKLVDKSWDPFGPGWFGDESDRIYKIIYEDKDGERYIANVKTSMFSGVYLTNNRKVYQTSRPTSGHSHRRIKALEAENRELREKLAKLKGRDA
ncbi:MAG: hypothetical protein Tsb002_38320 [Wenzhouxiangellaceae bacterium]